MLRVVSEIKILNSRLVYYFILLQYSLCRVFLLDKLFSLKISVIERV